MRMEYFSSLAVSHSDYKNAYTFWQNPAESLWEMAFIQMPLTYAER